MHANRRYRRCAGGRHARTSFTHGVLRLPPGCSLAASGYVHVLHRLRNVREDDGVPWRLASFLAALRRHGHGDRTLGRAVCRDAGFQPACPDSLPLSDVGAGAASGDFRDYGGLVCRHLGPEGNRALDRSQRYRGRKHGCHSVPWHRIYPCARKNGIPMGIGGSVRHVCGRFFSVCPGSGD